MIWFTCNKCRKQHSRPDSQAGSMVFCACGNGMRVPWSSTAEPADVVDAELVPPRPAAPPPPRPQPRRDDRDDAPRREPPRDEPAPSVRQQPARIPRRVRAGLCFNHDEDASADNCALCRLPFCKSCLVTLQGKALCGPCKNFQFAGMGRPARPLPLAVLALVVALVSAPVMYALAMLGLGLHLGEGMSAAGVALCFAAMALPITALVLALRSLGRLETMPHHTGRGMAAGGACVAAMGLLWAAGVAAYVLSRSSGGQP